VGLNYDWSGVAWSTTTYGSYYKNVVMLSPSHFLSAQHFETGSVATLGVQLQTQAGAMVSRTKAGMDNLGYGVEITYDSVTAKDLSIGTLTSAITAPSAIARYAVLDLHATSIATTYANYVGITALAYGRGTTTTSSPRVAATTVNQAGFLTPDPAQSVLLTLRAGASSTQMVVGDSAAPMLHGWTNPNGGSELTVLGVNSAIDGTYNYISMFAVPGAINAANAVMNADGFALRVTGNPVATWVGGTGGAPTNLNNVNNYSATPASDRYFAFDADATLYESINVNSATNMRGLFFLSTATAADGFTFSGASTLTLGRGGLVNYDADRQTITAPIALASSQYWDVGAGGVTANNINTAGHLLEIAGSGTAIISGNVSGTGGLALSGNRLEMTGTSSYSGNTWVHSGTLVVNGSITSSQNVTIAAGASLSGSGVLASSTLSGAGSVDPGNSPGVLTAFDANPAGGIDFNFEFTQANTLPDWDAPTTSINDVLRLTNLTDPFLSPLSSANVISLYLNVDDVNFGDTFTGGFYSDKNETFLTDISSALFQYWIADASGSNTYQDNDYSLYAGPMTFTVDTVAQNADFGSGTISGYTMRLTAIPETSTSLLAALSTLALLRRRRAIA
jgi:autotransporter-associated beta strand protein